MGNLRSTYDVFVTKASKLCQLLAHQELAFAYGGQNTVPDFFRNVIGFITKVLFKITDLLFKLEDLVL